MDISSISSMSIMQMMNYPQVQNSSVDDLFTTSDTDGSGGLSAEEFSSFDTAMKDAMSSDASSGSGAVPPPPPEMSSEDLFEQFDLNGDGEVTQAEMEEAQQSAQGGMSEGEESMSDLLGELMNQSFQSLMDMMSNSSSSSSDSEDEEQTSVVNQQFAAQIQEYMKQSSMSTASTSSVSSMISGTI